VKRLLLIILILQTISVLVFRTSIVSEFLKVQELIQHFAEHRQQNENFNFVDFIKIHYIHKQVFDEDYAQDMSLPFKTASAQIIGALDVTKRIEFTIPLFYCKVSKKKLVSNQSFLSQSYLGGIWQPPRA